MGTPVRLLIADDSDSVRQAIRLLLEQETGITVIGEARNFPELLKILNESIPEVILMDLHMPGEGRSDSDAIRAKLHGSCLLAMSIWNDKETANLAQSYGAMKLLDKSELASSLMPAIEECVSQNGKGQQ